MPLSEFSAPLPRMPAKENVNAGVTTECDNPARILTGGVSGLRLDVATAPTSPNAAIGHTSCCLSSAAFVPKTRGREVERNTSTNAGWYYDIMARAIDAYDQESRKLVPLEVTF